jgi:hypothetical protein
MTDSESPVATTYSLVSPSTTKEAAATPAPGISNSCPTLIVSVERLLAVLISATLTPKRRAMAESESPRSTL